MADPSQLELLARGVLATAGFRKGAARYLIEEETVDLIRSLSDDPEAGEPYEAVPSLRSVGCGARLQAKAIYLPVRIEVERSVVLLDVVPNEPDDRLSGMDLERILRLCDTITRLVTRALEWWNTSLP